MVFQRKPLEDKNINMANNHLVYWHQVSYISCSSRVSKMTPRVQSPSCTEWGHSSMVNAAPSRIGLWVLAFVTFLIYKHEYLWFCKKKKSHLIQPLFVVVTKDVSLSSSVCEDLGLQRMNLNFMVIFFLTVVGFTSGNYYLSLIFIFLVIFLFVYLFVFIWFTCMALICSLLDLPFY